jgi:Tfp pilus assembly protein PilV
MRSRVGGARKSAATSQRRAGISVVEVLVALVLLVVGLLGVAGSSAIAMRAAGSATRERRAAQRAADRAASLRAGGCALARGGNIVDSVAAVSERWTVSAVSGRAVLIDVDVRWSAPSGQKTLLLRSGMLC